MEIGVIRSVSVWTVQDTEEVIVEASRFLGQDSSLVLCGTRGGRTVSRLRMAWYYMLMNLCGLGCVDAGDIAGRDHSTVGHGERQFSAALKDVDSDWSPIFSAICAAIEAHIERHPRCAVAREAAETSSTDSSQPDSPKAKPGDTSSAA